MYVRMYVYVCMHEVDKLRFVVCVRAVHAHIHIHTFVNFK